MLVGVASVALPSGAARHEAAGRIGRQTSTEVMIMSAPVLDPGHMLAVTVPPGGFAPGTRVWVHRTDCWRPGVILHSSATAATVRYRPAEGRGTGVDTVTTNTLAARTDDDPFLDRET
jgi:hypothetical protein